MPRTPQEEARYQELVQQRNLAMQMGAEQLDTPNAVEVAPKRAQNPLEQFLFPQGLGRAANATTAGIVGGALGAPLGPLGIAGGSALGTGAYVLAAKGSDWLRNDQEPLQWAGHHVADFTGSETAGRFVDNSIEAAQIVFPSVAEKGYNAALQVYKNVGSKLHGIRNTAQGLSDEAVDVEQAAINAAHEAKQAKLDEQLAVKQAEAEQRVVTRQHKADASRESRQAQLESSRQLKQQQLDANREAKLARMEVDRVAKQQQLDAARDAKQAALEAGVRSKQARLDATREAKQAAVNAKTQALRETEQVALDDLLQQVQSDYEYTQRLLAQEMEPHLSAKGRPLEHHNILSAPDPEGAATWDKLADQFVTAKPVADLLETSLDEGGKFSPAALHEKMLSPEVRLAAGKLQGAAKKNFTMLLESGRKLLAQQEKVAGIQATQLPRQVVPPAEQIPRQVLPAVEYSLPRQTLGEVSQLPREVVPPAPQLPRQVLPAPTALPKPTVSIEEAMTAKIPQMAQTLSDLGVLYGAATGDMTTVLTALSGKAFGEKMLLRASRFSPITKSYKALMDLAVTPTDAALRGTSPHETLQSVLAVARFVRDELAKDGDIEGALELESALNRNKDSTKLHGN